MPLKPCPECEHQISDRAVACPNCGHPRETTGETRDSWRGLWQAVGHTKTPINVFALAMMACAAVFGYSATRLEQEALKGLTYSLHTFLVIAGMFFVCLLFCRKAIYHPDDLARVKDHGVDLGRDRPVLAAILIALMLAGYALYQGFVAGQ